MSDVTVLSRTQIIRVNPTSGKVAVINAGPPGPSGEVAFETGPQSPDGVWTFSQSPIIPDPDAATEAATKGYTDALVDALPTLEDGDRTTVDDATSGQVKVQLNADVPRVIIPTGLSTISNTAAETTAATFAIPANALLNGASLILFIAGSVLNNSGAARDLTIRVKCNGTTMWTFTMTALAASANQKGFFATVTSIISDFIGARPFGTGRYAIGSGTGDAIEKDGLSQSSIGGTVPATAHNWTVTVQMSAAHASYQVNLNSMQMLVKST